MTEYRTPEYVREWLDSARGDPKHPHTRGPWKASGPCTDRTGQLALEIGAETPAGHLSVAWVFGLAPGEDLKTAWADARLLAAAPEMLEALRDWMRWHDEDSLIARDRAVRLTRALLAKAEGREP